MALAAYPLDLKALPLEGGRSVRAALRLILERASGAGSSVPTMRFDLKSPPIWGNGRSTSAKSNFLDSVCWTNIVPAHFLSRRASRTNGTRSIASKNSVKGEFARVLCLTGPKRLRKLSVQLVHGEMDLGRQRR